MRVACTALAFAGAVSLGPGVAWSQTVLTLGDALAKAREQAPEVVSARLALEEARGRVTGASLRLQSNPEFGVNVGNRQSLGSRSTDLEFSGVQMFEPPGRRAARIAGATAQLDQGVALAESTIRQVLQETATWFYRAVYAGERGRLLARSEELASAILQAADRRYRVGDLAVLDVNLARASLARARSERAANEADRTAALGSLRVLLRIEGSITVEGTLALASQPDAAALGLSVEQRPEIRALESAIREADADVSLSRTFSKPDYGAAVRYQREGGDNILVGGLTFTLPTFSKGQELRAAGTARGARLRAELDAARSRVRLELQTALAAYGHRVAAVQVLEAEALPGLDENDALATRSFDVGQIGLPDVLLIRREILETRFQYLSALLEAALARVVVDATAAVLR
jgi:cobalt-zinc-cadmium efflux system outer membrane protein